MKELFYFCVNLKKVFDEFVKEGFLVSWIIDKFDFVYVV